MGRGIKQDIKQDTKHKIASAVRQLMQERSLRKITVQDVMELTRMTRQSFYYHFQDIQNVLSWMVEQQVDHSLQGTEELSFEDWMMRVFALLDEDRCFYRQVLSYGDPCFLHRFGNKLLRQRMVRLLFHTENEQKLKEPQRFVVDFSIQMVLAYLTTFLSSRRPLDPAESRIRLNCLLDTLSLNDETKSKNR